MSTVDLDPITSLTNCKLHQPATPLIPPAIPAEGPHIISEDESTHVMYLGDQLIGVAHTHHEATTTLAELIDEIALSTHATTADLAAEAVALRLGMEMEVA